MVSYILLICFYCLFIEIISCNNFKRQFFKINIIVCKASDESKIQSTTATKIRHNRHFFFYIL